MIAKRTIFVFGSNLKGVHGAGAALHAVEKWGAIRGRGEGIQGDSYAIPTKETWRRRLDLQEIEQNIKRFIKYAKEHPELHFIVTAVGCGLAGYKPAQIAPMFFTAPKNCDLPAEFEQILEQA